MERRAFIVMTLAAVGWPLAVGAQQKTPVIGWLGGPSSQAASNLAAFRQGLRETGYVQEQNVAIEYRWTEGHPDRAPELAAELVGRKVDMIAATGDASALAAKSATSRAVKGRTVKGLNFFSRAEQTLLAALQRPSFNISGLRRADLVPLVVQCSPPTLTRHLARLRQLGVIKRVTGTYRYYLTRAGRAAIAAGRRLTEHTIIPALA